MSTVASEKQGNVVYRQLVLQTVRSLRVVSLVFRGQDLLKIANINPQQEATLSLWKKNQWVRSHTSREVKNATISEFSIFLKSSKSREQFLLRLTFFYPIYGKRLKFFNFYGYRLNFWPFYAYRLTPLRPSMKHAGRRAFLRKRILLYIRQIDHS